MRIFGREPAVWIGVIEAALATAMAARWIKWDANQEALVMACVVAVFGVVSAYLTHDTMLGVLSGLAKAVIAVALGFGVTLTPELTAALIAFVTVVVSFFQRTQTSPALVPSLKPVPMA